MILVLVLILVGTFMSVGCRKKLTAAQRNELEAKKTALDGEIKELDRRTAIIDAEIEKHQTNVKKMKEILKKGKKDPSQLDPGRLKQSATATGQRTEAYHRQEPWMQALTEKLEGDQGTNVFQALVLAGGFLISRASGQGDKGFNRTHYIVEITRSNQIIKILTAERDKMTDRRNQADAERQRITEVLQASETISSAQSQDSLMEGQGGGDGGGSSGY
jgi:predicted Zn-dependent peptidase